MTSVTPMTIWYRPVFGRTWALASAGSRRSVRCASSGDFRCSAVQSMTKARSTSSSRSVRLFEDEPFPNEKESDPGGELPRVFAGFSAEQPARAALAVGGALPAFTHGLGV